MLSCWDKDADKRLTFTEIVSQYCDGILPGTSNADIINGGAYVLLGPEGDTTPLQRAKTLHETSKMDITVINRHKGTPPVTNGTTFDVVYLTEPDLDYYIDMNSSASVFENHAAEYDDIAAESQESGDDSQMTADIITHADHVTARTDHVTTHADHVTTSKKNVASELRVIDEYILMQSAGPAVPNSH